jgi:hypothetical protein
MTAATQTDYQTCSSAQLRDLLTRRDTVIRGLVAAATTAESTISILEGYLKEREAELESLTAEVKQLKQGSSNNPTVEKCANCGKHINHT